MHTTFATYMNTRALFLKYNAQTSPTPLPIEIVRASGNYLYCSNGKQYIDLIGGISVCNIGHCHPAVVQAIQYQATQYLHVMVYGEVALSPQVQYAQWLVQHLPSTLNSVYFTNSGTEATEGAMKLAKRVTGKANFVSCTHSYHGHTQGALSIMGSEVWKQAYRPLLPGCKQVAYNDYAILDAIDDTTAAVIVEPIQAESGVVQAHVAWLQAIRAKCNHTCTLLIYDEIQSGFGRTGALFALDTYQVIPDILLLGKALGGGMPMGAFIADAKLMHSLSHSPILGHLSTFGGHPVCCAAGLAAAQVLVANNGDIISGVAAKEQLFIQHLQHHKITAIRSAGLWMAVELSSFEVVQQVISYCLQHGVFTDWFLYASNCIRIAPPLTITEHDIIQACSIMKAGLNAVDL